MKIGTKSLLFGVHAFWLHPFFVAWGWWSLYGFPWDPRLWVAFVVHDWGYWGKPNMDGVEGESHVMLGANIMHRLFDFSAVGYGWYDFTLLHSRFVAQRDGVDPSALCYADKMAFILTPWWLYRILANATGEIHEYMGNAKGGGKYASMQIWSADQRVWFERGQSWMKLWVKEQTGAE